MENNTKSQNESDLEVKIQVLREAAQFAKREGYSQVTIDVDLLEILLNRSNNTKNYNL